MGTNETDEPRIVMVGPGYGLEINGGRVLTALHVAESMDFPIVYQNADKDIAVIFTNHSNHYKLKFIGSKDDFIFIETMPRTGESGMPCLIGNKVYGVIVGESNGKGLVTMLDETVISILNQTEGLNEREKEKRLE
jgi:hypothetical protein